VVGVSHHPAPVGPECFGGLDFDPLNATSLISQGFAQAVFDPHAAHPYAATHEQEASVPRISQIPQTDAKLQALDAALKEAEERAAQLRKERDEHLAWASKVVVIPAARWMELIERVDASTARRMTAHKPEPAPEEGLTRPQVEDLLREILGWLHSARNGGSRTRAGSHVHLDAARWDRILAVLCRLAAVDPRAPAWYGAIPAAGTASLVPWELISPINRDEGAPDPSIPLTNREKQLWGLLASTQALVEKAYREGWSALGIREGIDAFKCGPAASQPFYDQSDVCKRLQDLDAEVGELMEVPRG
jgi:hypothetical protein